jgi:DNA-binding MarR family transcriptional regulator
MLKNVKRMLHQFNLQYPWLHTKVMRLFVEVAEEHDSGGIILTDLVSILKERPYNVSRYITRLEDLGLVKRSRWALDGRKKPVILTENGKKLIDSIKDD